MPRKKTGSAVVEAAGGAIIAPAAGIATAPGLDLGENAGGAETGGAISAGTRAGGDDEAFALADVPPARGPGRPAGAKNVRDAKLIELVERRHGSPLEALAGIYARASDPVRMWLELRTQSQKEGVSADDLNLTIKDCLDMAIRAAIAALPYMVKKQPVALEVQSDAQAVVFNITIGDRQVGLTEQRAARILEGEEIEDPEVLAAIAAFDQGEVK